MTLAENVRLLRQERGITQSQLARGIGIAPARISELERSTEPNPTLQTITKIAEFFDVSEASLLSPRNLSKNGN
jgi:transcriptional regulator with XRE-family HTH domain